MCWKIKSANKAWAKYFCKKITTIRRQAFSTKSLVENLPKGYVYLHFCSYRNILTNFRKNIRILMKKMRLESIEECQ